MPCFNENRSWSLLEAGGQGNRLFLEASHSPNSDKFDVGRRGRRGPPPHGFPANSFPPETESATDRLPSSVVAAPLHDQGQGHSGLRPKPGEKGACREAKTALSSLAGGGRASKVEKSGGGMTEGYFARRRRQRNLHESGRRDFLRARTWNMERNDGKAYIADSCFTMPFSTRVRI